MESLLRRAISFTISMTRNAEGKCSGAVNTFECKDCDEDKPTCNTDVGKEQHLIGKCGTSNDGTTTGNTYACKDCGNQECAGDFEFRAGSCEEATGYTFFCNTQPVCFVGEYVDNIDDSSRSTILITRPLSVLVNLRTIIEVHRPPLKGGVDQCSSWGR